MSSVNSREGVYGRILLAVCLEKLTASNGSGRFLNPFQSVALQGYAAQHAEQAGLVQNGLGGALPAGSGSQADGMMAGMGMHGAVAAGQQPGPPGMPLQMGPDGAQSAV